MSCGNSPALRARRSTESVILADIGAALADAIKEEADAGSLLPSGATLTASGTWRPAATKSPGSYATSLPFGLARLAGRPAEAIAAQLALRLTSQPWVSSVTTASGYLTVTVAARHLAGLPARVVAAGRAVARSDALPGTRLVAPGLPDLAAEPGWADAWQKQHEALNGRLAEAAGAEVFFTPAEAGAGSGEVAEAVFYRGLDAVRFALAAAPVFSAANIHRQLTRPLDVSNPFVLVSHAHADASSNLRWAFDLGLTAERGARDALEPEELALIDAMSWFPERVAAAARRRRPADLVAYLAGFALAWLNCTENCPALPFRGSKAPADPAGPLAGARLELADAARVALASGLALLAVAAPSRL